MPNSDSESAQPRPNAAALFEATQWSVVLRARDKSEPAMNRLCESYRQPLITWLRVRNYSPHDAEDLVHGLFAKLLAQDFLNNVAKEKGRFRTFLLRCLKNYLLDQHAKTASARRGGGQPTGSLDATFEDGEPIHEPVDSGHAPDAAYDKAWVATLLANSLKRLQEECGRQGRAALCAELEPVMFYDEDASGYREIAGRLGMTEAAVKMAASRLRARLKGLFGEEIRQTVSNPQDWEEEVRYLMQLYSR